MMVRFGDLMSEDKTVWDRADDDRGISVETGRHFRFGTAENDLNLKKGGIYF